MAKFLVLFAAIASVHGAVRVGWSPPPPPPTTTPAPPPPTTPGWSPPPTTAPPPPPPTTTPGWSPPPPPPPQPSGWGPGPAPINNVTVALTGELAAAGAGWAAENHNENIQVTGGWGVPADLLVATGGESVVAQEGTIVQATNVDSTSATSLNAISVSNVAEADETLAVIASGVDIAVGQAGWAGAAGEAASAADGTTAILVNA